LLFIIFAGGIVSYKLQYATVPSIIDKGCYFMGGLLLADFYTLRKKENNGQAIALGILFIFICWLFIPSYFVSIYFCVLKLFITLLIFYFAITNDVLKRILSKKIITITGGMCYSIYLIHMGVYGVMRHHFFSIHFFDNIVLNITIQCIIAVTIVLAVSGIFFLLIEKPTMKRDWYKGIFKKRVYNL
jgi:peptidoglycan/LPS O-acetylase OafA/YrhL